MQSQFQTLFKTRMERRRQQPHIDCSFEQRLQRGAGKFRAVSERRQAWPVPTLQGLSDAGVVRAGRKQENREEDYSVMKR